MIIKQNKKDGTAEIIFSWKEIWTLIKKRRLKFTAESFKHLTNNFIKIIMEFNENFDDNIQRKITDSNQVKINND